MSGDGDQVKVWRWCIKPPGPHLTRTLPAVEALRGAAVSARREMGYGMFPASFHGDGHTDHQHSFWLPEDEDGDGLIDHIAVFCAYGIDSLTISGLAAVPGFMLGERFYRIAPSWMGARPRGGLFGPATCWKAVTPYITPRHRLTKTGKARPDCRLEAQFPNEIARRDLPLPLSVHWEASTWCGEDRVLASQFITERRKEGEGPPGDAVASFPHVRFAEAVSGPLAFGYGAHFGMGFLAPFSG
jgi:CRISPR-associated protein Csb2